MKKQDYEKLRTSLRYWLLGKNFMQAAKALEFGLSKHTGLRKDGVMPEYQHQVSQCSFARTLIPWMIYPEETLTTILLHDVVEDTDVEREEIRELFGDLVHDGVDRMTNQINGVKLPKALYYSRIFNHPISSIAKPIDRIHNHQTMPGVFLIPKQVDYVGETKEFIIPGMKDSRKIYPEQEPAYQNVKHVLLTQMELLELTWQEKVQ